MKKFKFKPFTITAVVIFGSILFMNSVSAVEIIKSGNVEYRTHVQNEGWQAWKDEGEKSGTSGQSLRLEGIEIKVTNLPDKTHQVGIRYKTHVENIGWQDWVADGIMSGTEGKSYRLEAIQIELTGADADKYDVYYRVHAQNIGWLGWSKDGASSGTAGYGYRLEAIEIQLKPKAESAPEQGTKKSFYEYATDGFSFIPSNTGGNWQNGDPTGAEPGHDPVFGDE